MSDEDLLYLHKIALVISIVCLLPVILYLRGWGMVIGVIVWLVVSRAILWNGDRLETRIETHRIR